MCAALVVQPVLEVLEVKEAHTFQEERGGVSIHMMDTFNTHGLAW